MTKYTPPSDFQQYRVLDSAPTRRADALLRKVIALDEPCHCMFAGRPGRGLMSEKRRLALTLPSFREVNAEELAETSYAESPCYQGNWSLPAWTKLVCRSAISRSRLPALASTAMARESPSSESNGTPFSA